MIAVTGVGLLTPLGDSPQVLRQALEDGCGALRSQHELRELPCDLGAAVQRCDLRPWLLRRKDRKLMSRAAQLALPAAGSALGDWPGDRDDVGLFVGIGREPPDAGDAERSLAASERDGQLCPRRLAGPGQALYPPLLPLLTLPNLVLSHVAINLGIRGENGTAAGEAAAGLCALVEALRVLKEGRAPAALAGAADSRVDFASARDLYRLGRAGPQRAPAEGAVFLLLEPMEAARQRGARIWGGLRAIRRGPSSEVAAREHWSLTGDLGAADALFALASALLFQVDTAVSAHDDEGGAAAVHCSPHRDTL